MNTHTENTIVFHGSTISPGLAEGVIYLLPTLSGPLDIPGKHQAYSVENEYHRLDEATAKITDDLLFLAARVEKELDKKLAEVFGAHSQIVNDKLLKEELRKEIVDNLVSAGSAVKSVFLRWENRFLLMESAIAREKSDDFRDISIRLRNALAGITAHPFESIPDRCVLATQRLLPSDTVFISRKSTRAILLESGSIGSHAALFTRQMSVPCISGIANILNVLPHGANALIEAHQHDGVVTVNPDKPMKTSFYKQVKQHARQRQLAKTLASRPATTEDGVVVTINANIGSYEDASSALEYGADGIGLYRLEQFYIGRSLPPSVDELIAEMRHTLQPFTGKSICVRLLDIGSDKPLPFIGFLAEPNPALGRRGIRLMREYPELLTTQLKALLALATTFDIQLLVPMVTIPEDMEIVRDALSTLCAQIRVSPPPLGAMIETPAAALSASNIAPYVDFFSFGTNDLTQYTFAADRENVAVESYYTDTSAVIIRLIALVHNDAPTVPLSICGELAGRRHMVHQLLRCGVRSLSVSAPLIPSIKEAVRCINLVAIENS